MLRFVSARVVDLLLGPGAPGVHPGDRVAKASGLGVPPDRITHVEFSGPPDLRHLPCSSSTPVRSRRDVPPTGSLLPVSGQRDGRVPPGGDTRIAHTWRSFVRKIYRLIFHLHAISRCKVGCERYGQSPALRMLALAQAHAPPAGHRSDLDGRRVAPLAGARADSRDRACRGARGAADRRAATRAGRDAQRMAGAEDSALAELIPEPHSQSRTHRGSSRAPSARLPNPLRRAGLRRERRRQRAAGGSRRRRPGGRWPPPGGWHTRRAPGTPPLWRPGPARHHPTARPIYQVPRSPSFAMTSLNRSAALRQFPCTARSVASGSPCRIASTIASCSTVDSSMRSASALMYSQQ